MEGKEMIVREKVKVLCRRFLSSPLEIRKSWRCFTIQLSMVSGNVKGVQSF
jgi:hypothetical protein